MYRRRPAFRRRGPRRKKPLPHPAEERRSDCALAAFAPARPIVVTIITVVSIAIVVRPTVAVVAVAFVGVLGVALVVTLLATQLQSWLSAQLFQVLSQKPGSRLVEMVMADHYGWDRYNAQQWMTVNNWLRNNPDDPDADALQDWMARSQRGVTSPRDANTGRRCAKRQDF